MMKAEVDDWLRRYVAAWQSYEHDDIAALFTSDVEYRYHPWDEPDVGADTIARSWVEPDQRDEPGTWQGEYRCIAVDDDVAVATGTSTYFVEPGGAIRTLYYNCFVMRFAEDGKCSQFTEFFMEHPKDH